MAPEDTGGRLVAGRYRLDEPLGRGGMGVVWRAEDTLLQRVVAIKEVEFPPYATPDEEAALRERVFREARAAARLSHPSAVTLYDVVEDGGRVYIVMELIEAPTLADLVERQGPLSPRETAQVGLDVLGALEAAHTEGIVHRDVKPANVMVPARGRARLADFGIASIKGDPRVTSSGQVIGSPSYMAPEQANGQDCGPPADLWSLGTTLYYAVEGHPPFQRGEAIPTLTAVVHDDPEPWKRAGPLGPTLDALLVKAPEGRLAAGELRDRLAEVATGDGAGRESAPAEPPPNQTQVLAPPAPPAEAPPPARPVPPPPPEVDVAPAEPEPPAPVRPLPERGPGGPGGRRAVLVAVVAAVGLAVLVLLALALRGDDDGRQPEARTAPTTTSPSGQPATTRAGGRSSPSMRRGWVRYRDPATGYTIAHPAGWTITRRGRITDFRDPRSSTYLRVDWTPTPGPDPQADWERFEPQFAAQNAGYQRIHMRPTTFQGYPASDWEFTYTAGGARLHAVDLGFVTGRYGFALNFQTREEDWESSQDTFETFKGTFVAPA